MQRNHIGMNNTQARASFLACLRNYTHLYTVDGIYSRCEARNVYAALKPTRTHTTRLRIADATDRSGTTATSVRTIAQEFALLPALQPATVTLSVGETLRLFCAPRHANAATVLWTRRATVDDAAVTTTTKGSGIVFTVQNITASGVYNCSTAYEFQVRAPILIPPAFKTALWPLSGTLFWYVCSATTVAGEFPYVLLHIDCIVVCANARD